MRPAPFEFIRPTSVGDAVAQAGQGVFLAGGQSLVPQMKLRERRPARVVDLNALAELDYLVDDSDQIRIGAMTRYCTVLESEEVRRHAPVLCESILKLGDVQVRARGTLGGNLCWGDSRANTPVALMALDARVSVVTRTGVDVLAIGDFQSSGPSDRLVTGFQIPKQPGSHQRYLEISLQPSSLPIVNMAGVLRGGTGGSPVSEARLAAGGLSDVAVGLSRVEALLHERVLDQTVIEECVAALDTENLQPLDNVQATAAYRLKAARVLLRRLLHDVSTASMDASSHTEPSEEPR